jgi:hypothetical protein
MTYQRGDFVRLSSGDRRIRAMVMLASPNGRSLVLGFEGLFRGHLGMMPVLQDEAGVYHTVFTDAVVEIERLERP